MLPAVARLLPPFFHNDFVWINLVLAPQITAAVHIEENSLENVFIQRECGVPRRSRRVPRTTRGYSLKLLELVTIIPHPFRRTCGW